MMSFKKQIFIIFVCCINTINIYSMSSQTPINKNDDILIRYKIYQESVIRSQVIIDLLSNIPKIAMPTSTEINYDKPFDVISKLQKTPLDEQLAFCLKLNSKQIKKIAHVTNFLINMSPIEPITLTCSDDDVLPPLESDDIEMTIFENNANQLKTELSKKISNQRIKFR